MDASAVAGRRPEFKRHLRAEVSEGEGAFLFSEGGVIALRGPEVASLAALLDGERDLASLLRARPGGMDAEQVAGLIAQLVAADLVTLRAPGAAAADPGALAYWDECGAAVGTAGTVALVAAGIPAGPVRAALHEAGVAIAPGGAAEPVAGTDLTVVLCDDYLNPALAEVDAAHRAAGRPWLLAKPAGSRVWLGPVFTPGAAACWHCLTHRLWGHRHAEACAQAALGRSGPAPKPVAAVPPLTSAAAHLVALEVSKWLAGHRHPGQRGVWTFDSHSLASRWHDLRARPQCPTCGDATMVAARAHRPVRLRPAPKASGSGGGHRTLTPAEMLDRHRHLISPVTGIVKEVVRDPAAPAFVSAYRSGANVARGITQMGALRASLRFGNGGKGVTPVDAEVGALCEAVERYSGTWQGDEARVRGSLRALGDEAIHPNDCMLFSPEQYATRTAWNRAHSPFNFVCEPVDEDAEMDWTPLWSLTGQRHRLLPTAMLYFGAPGSRCVRADSNGAAAGSSIEDAVLQGTLELVERDAVAAWWYNRTRVPAVDLAAFGDPWVDELRGHYARLGREFWVLDVTSDLGVPVFAAVTRRVGAPAERIMLGFGAHLDPRTALRRALTEMNQLLPAVLGDAVPDGDPDATYWLRHATVANQPYLMPAAGRSSGPADSGYVARADVNEDVSWLVAAIQAQGMETLVLDQTRPDVGVPVVKVVVPGMRAFWARFAPGRLFDVPVRTGALTKPTAYEDLNPVPLFL
ncbi:MAG TPA: TOMM precursor leader peptide-binding protein [Pilimelia sp.]|nr:TOMM precursor leader peptide-binding protein [Pilimelia sp.]